jgi:hypothetical protein
VLVYLAATDPGDVWSQFLDKGGAEPAPRWSYTVARSYARSTETCHAGPAAGEDAVDSSGFIHQSIDFQYLARCGRASDLDYRHREQGT